VLHDQLKAFSLIAVKETCVIIIAKVVWIGPTIPTYIATFSRVDAHWVGHFVHPVE
jgi:hypothetical protein